MNERQRIRREVLHQRGQLSPSVVQAFSLLLVERLSELPIFKQSHSVALYMPVKGEISSLGIMKVATKNYYLPLLGSTDSEALTFVRYRSGDVLQNNRYNIPEPTLTENQQKYPAELDLVLVPLVAVDDVGNRLGMGKGFYDRTFSFLRESALRKPFLLGIAYEFQKVNHVPPALWDVPLHAVLTEKNDVIY